MPRTRKKSKRSPRAAKQDYARQASGGFLFASLAVIMLLLTVHVGKIWMQRRTDQLGLEWERKSRQMAQLRDQQENLRMQKESLTDGAYILERASRMGLDAPQPGQVRRLYDTTSSVARPSGEELVVHGQMLHPDE